MRWPELCVRGCRNEDCENALITGSPDELIETVTTTTPLGKTLRQCLPVITLASCESRRRVECTRRSTSRSRTDVRPMPHILQADRDVKETESVCPANPALPEASPPSSVF